MVYYKNPHNWVISIIPSWQPLGPLQKVKLLVGYGLHVKSHDQLKGAYKGVRRSPKM